MKNLVLLFLALWAVSAVAQTTVRVVADDYSHLTVKVGFDAPRVREALLDGETFVELEMEGTIPSGEVGCPNLPQSVHMIEVPLCDGISVGVVKAEYDTIRGLKHWVVPVQPERRKSDTMHHVAVMNDKSYASTYGLELAKVEMVGVARNRRLARLQMSPVRYNAEEGTLVVCRSMEVEISYQNSDQEGTLALWRRHYSPAFDAGQPTLNTLYPKTGTGNGPVRYLVVAHSMFRGQLDDFADWKRRQGMLTDVVYTGDPGVGTTASSIGQYVKNQYMNATEENPAPSYVLLVGDVAQVPPFVGVADTAHVTDLYYVSWTNGDNIPDAYCGRFSAQNTTQLQAMIAKTLMHEKYAFPDPSFLDHAVLVGGVDRGETTDYGYNQADPAMDYAATHYVNGTKGYDRVDLFKNNTGIVPSATNVVIGSSAANNAAAVRAAINQGAGWVNYSAHGGTTGWGTPSFTNSHVPQMTNTNKFGVVVANCCLTSKFDESECFAEALLRRGDNCGAVAYIGGTNYTYWGPDFYWAIGVRSSITANMSLAYNANNLGAYDRLCHTHNEPYSQWATTVGGLVMAGNMAVELSTSTMKRYYWEVYELMGDPSLMPYLTRPRPMSVCVPSGVAQNTTTLQVQAVPYAYVAMTDTLTHSLKAATQADANGQAVLIFPSTLAVGGYEVVASAQQYQTTFVPLSVLSEATPNIAVAVNLNANHVTAGGTLQIPVSVTNTSASSVGNVQVAMSSNNPYVTLTRESQRVGSVSAHETRNLATQFSIQVAADAPDMTDVEVLVSTTWAGSTTGNSVVAHIQIYAPRIEMSYPNFNPSVVPGYSRGVTLKLSNKGHAPLQGGVVTVSPATHLMTVSPSTNRNINIEPGAELVRQYTVQAQTALPTNIQVPIGISLSGQTLLSDTISMYVGSVGMETFESGTFHQGTWGQGGHAWTFATDTVYQGAYSLKSASGLDHNQTSEVSVVKSNAVADSVVFYYKVSSETNYDKLHFYIDGTDMMQASGLMGWTRASFPVAAGTHTYKFSYQKDYSVSRYGDCAWVDNIRFPLDPRATNYSNAILCEGEPLVVNGATVATPPVGTGTYVSTNATGPLQIVDYEVVRSVLVETTVTACDQYVYGGRTYQENCTIVDTIASIGACDSINQIALTIKHSSRSTVADSVTACDRYEVGGREYTASGVVVRHLTNQEGCDSTCTLVLEIHHSVEHYDSVSVCDHYEYGGVSYDESIVLGDTLMGSNGCDSVNVLALEVRYSVAIFDTVEACDHYEYEGEDYSETVQLSHTWMNEVGCDSTVTLTLLIHSSVEDSVAVVTNGETYDWNGTTYTETGTYIQTLQTQYGCDSVVTLHLVIEPMTEEVESLEESSMRCYPCPTNGLVHFDSRVDRVEVYDLAGRKMTQETHVESIDLGAMPQGSYTLRMTLDGKTAQCRIIVIK